METRGSGGVPYFNSDGGLTVGTDKTGMAMFSWSDIEWQGNEVR